MASLARNSLKKHMFLAARMDEVERVETLTVPFKVVREATLNTIIHRDWDAYNLTPSIAIFEARWTKSRMNTYVLN